VRNGPKDIEPCLLFGLIGFAVVGLSHCFSGTTVNVRSVDGDFTALHSALEMYRENGGGYPTQEQGLEALHTRPTVDPLPDRWTGLLHSEEQLIDPWGTLYRYRMPGSVDPVKPEIISAGEDGLLGTQDDLSSHD